jgi:hypothetical protein
MATGGAVSSQDLPFRFGEPGSDTGRWGGDPTEPAGETDSIPIP